MVVRKGCADRNIDLGFEADFVWIKARNSANANRLYDRVRGNGQVLFSDLTNAEFNGLNDGIHFDYVPSKKKVMFQKPKIVLSHLMCFCSSLHNLFFIGICIS